MPKDKPTAAQWEKAEEWLREEMPELAADKPVVDAVARLTVETRSDAKGVLRLIKAVYNVDDAGLRRLVEAIQRAKDKSEEAG